MKLFDVEQIARRYHIVLEPSWCGFCSLDVMMYTRLPYPVFIESGEPRDTAFLRAIQSNLIPVPVAGNWWVDYRVYRPLPDASKDVDVIVLAAWARYKKHNELFRLLAPLVRGGRVRRIVLIGYPGDLSREDVLREAEGLGIRDALEVHESLEPEQVNFHLNRSRVSVLWSPKEGFNRAIVEGMFANVPCLIRRGHNFGYEYPHVNPLTGRFAGEHDFHSSLLEILDHPERFSPREWVMRQMNCHDATTLINAAIRELSRNSGQPWTRDLVSKTVWLHGMRYWDGSDSSRFEEDYSTLKGLKKLPRV